MEWTDCDGTFPWVRTAEDLADGIDLTLTSDDLIHREVRVREGMGITEDVSWELSPPAGDQLLGRVLDGVTYGQLVSWETFLIVPANLLLAPAFPNPFNGETMVRFFLSEAGPVQLRIFTMQGREIFHKRWENQSRGWHQEILDLDRLPQRQPASGILLLLLESRGETRVGRLLFLS